MTTSTTTTTPTTSRVSNAEVAKNRHNFVFGSWLIPNVVAWVAAIVMWFFIAGSDTGQVAGFTSGSLFAAVAMFTVVTTLIPVFVSVLMPTAQQDTAEDAEVAA